MVTKVNNKRLLPERANIEFWYPDNETVLFLPFFENPKIQEVATANYVDYNPMSRAGSLYVYTGAKSRKIRIEASYTLPDLMTYPMGISAYKKIFEGKSTLEQKALFYKNHANSNTTALDTKSSIAREARTIYFSYDPEVIQGQADTAAIIGGGIVTGQTDYAALASVQANIASVLSAALDKPEQDKAIDTMLFFVAMLRSSVLNNTTNPIEGPPLARLNFGTMYASVPCIVKNYSITWEEAAGYDVETLTPRRLIVTIEMDEVRASRETEFERSSIKTRDNLTGWESVIAEPHNLDPGAV